MQRRGSCCGCVPEPMPVTCAQRFPWIRASGMFGGGVVGRLAGSLIWLVRAPGSAAAAVTITRADIQAMPNGTRVTLESPEPLRFRLLSLQRRVILELEGAVGDPVIRALTERGAPGDP